MNLRSIINRTVISIFLALVLGIIVMQTLSKFDGRASLTQPSEPVMESMQPETQVEDVCGDRRCTGSENCSSCQSDCGLCIQTYCCNTDRRECDGPFGVEPTSNPCDIVGYAKYLYAYENGNIDQRSKAYMTCNNSCSSL